MDTNDNEDAMGNGHHMIAMNVRHERSVLKILVTTVVSNE